MQECNYTLQVTHDTGYGEETLANYSSGAWDSGGAFTAAAAS